MNVVSGDSEGLVGMEGTADRYEILDMQRQMQGRNMLPRPRVCRSGYILPQYAQIQDTGSSPAVSFARLSDCSAHKRAKTANLIGGSRSDIECCLSQTMT